MKPTILLNLDKEHIMINLDIKQIKIIFEAGYEKGERDNELKTKDWHSDPTSKDLELVYTLCDVLNLTLDEATEMLQTC